MRAIKREAIKKEKLENEEKVISKYDTAKQISSYETIRATKKVNYISILERYCKLKGLPVDEQKFCYDTETIVQDINRLLEYGADEYRICKKVKAINPDFCKISNDKSFSKSETKNVINTKTRGIIFE